MRLVDWSGTKLMATDECGSSDPFLKFFIRGSRKKRYKSWYKRGGLIGRTTQTDVQYNTLNPDHMNAKRPLYYHGTRSDLENETLRIECWDWDPASRNDLMGFAEVPLRGVLLSGRITTALAMHSADDVSAAEPGGRLTTAGNLSGGLEMLSEPAHTQFGDVVKRLPKMTYLAVHVQSAIDLVGKKVDGMSDPYVTAVWAAVSQQTRVIRSTCAPQYEETLYFPTNLVRINASELEAKGDVVLYVLHHDKTSPVDIGFCRIPLDKITSAPVKRIEDSGVNVKTRVYESRLFLQQPGVTRKEANAGELKVRLYFTPDLPSDVILQERQHSAHEMPEAYQQREADWRADIPFRLLATGRFLCSALDETNTRRFVPTFLSKCAPPREMSDPKMIARMVHCIAFQVDSHLVGRKSTSRSGGGGGAEELWSSPNYFLDVKKGASEDHAVLQASLFLGLGLDAYIAIGRLPGGVQQHVWVMTREPNGDVLFWETTKGDHYTLPSRWSGLYLEGAADAAATMAGTTDLTEVSIKGVLKRPKPKVKVLKGAAGFEIEDKRKQRAAAALARDKAEREAEKKAKELAEAQASEEKLLFLADEEQWTTGAQANPYETPRDFTGNTSGMQQEIADEYSYDDSADEANGRPRVKSAAFDVLQGALQRTKKMSNVVSKIRTSLAESQQEMEEHGIRESSIHDAPDDEYESYDEAALPTRGAARQSKPLAELDLPPMKEQLPYETLEVLINHENVWANLQGHSIPSCGFDLEESDRWLPFIEPGVWEPHQPPRPFYSVARIGPQLPPQRLSALRLQLYRAIKSAYADYRTTRSLRTRWATNLEPTLDQGLQVLENAACSSSVTEMRAVDKWRGQLLGALPPDYKFIGRAFSFSVTTPELVVDYLMSNYSYHQNGHKEAVFALSVQVFAHYGAVASTWVYIGCLSPHAKAKKKKDDKED